MYYKSGSIVGLDDTRSSVYDIEDAIYYDSFRYTDLEIFKYTYGSDKFKETDDAVDFTDYNKLDM